MQTYLVTGANRGLGLALADKLLQSGHRVIAGARNPDGARELWELQSYYKNDRLKVLTLDVADAELEQTLARDLGPNEVVDVLINNAGIAPEYERGFEALTFSGIEKVFKVNVMGPMRATRAVLPYLKRSTHAVIANISSKVGSIADNQSGGGYAYRMSKAAVNMLNKNLSLEFPGIICVALHPGWVQTDMGGSQAPVTPRESAEGLCQVIGGLKKANSGRFYDFRGKELPW